MVNIFTDLYYLTFVQELNKSLSGWQPTLLPNSTCPLLAATTVKLSGLAGVGQAGTTFAPSPPWDASEGSLP